MVYGDIGISPLDALKTAVAAARGGADNRGEGGILALLALLKAREAPPRSWRAALLIVGLVGAALLYGDGVTPTISVLSAVEGLKLDAPVLAPAAIPITLAVLLGLFLVQRKGTGFIGGVLARDVGVVRGPGSARAQGDRALAGWSPGP